MPAVDAHSGHLLAVSSVNSFRLCNIMVVGGAMGSADEVNIQASELNRTMKVCNGGYVAVLHGYVCCMDDVLHELRVGS